MSRGTVQAPRARLSERDKQMILRAKRHGIHIPAIACEEWKAQRNRHREFDFALMCALLMAESYGGLNLFGGDPTIYVHAGRVTRKKYLAYKRLRDETGKSQGVGAMQLTYSLLQDAADRIGGCWQPRLNLRVGIKEVNRLLHEHGYVEGLRRWNGSGAGAVRYSRSVRTARGTWRVLLADDRLARLDTVTVET